MELQLTGNPLQILISERYFSTQEDENICQAWIEVGGAKSRKTLGQRLLIRLNELMGCDMHRTPDSLESRWETIKLSLLKFSACLKGFMSPTGEITLDNIYQAKWDYALRVGVKFQFEGCWEIMKETPMFRFVLYGTCPPRPLAAKGAKRKREEDLESEGRKRNNGLINEPLNKMMEAQAESAITRKINDERRRKDLEELMEKQAADAIKLELQKEIMYIDKLEEERKVMEMDISEYHPLSQRYFEAEKKKIKERWCKEKQIPIKPFGGKYDEGTSGAEDSEWLRDFHRTRKQKLEWKIMESERTKRKTGLINEPLNKMMEAQAESAITRKINDERRRKDLEELMKKQASDAMKLELQKEIMYIDKLEEERKVMEMDLSEYHPLSQRYFEAEEKKIKERWCKEKQIPIKPFGGIYVGTSDAEDSEWLRVFHRARKQKLEWKIMGMNLNGLSPLQRGFFKAKQNEILQRGSVV